MNNYRPTWAEINLDALWYNIEYARKHLNNQEIIPVIKANAYGHGAIPIFEFLIKKGIKCFTVSLLEEALELRAINKDVKILMMGAILKEDFKIASIHDIDVTIYSNDILKEMVEEHIPLRVHLKIDSGMNRYGIKDLNEVKQAIDMIEHNPHLIFEGIYSHFATANENETYYKMQLNFMKDLLSQMKKKPPMIHISNSSSTLKYEKDYDFTTHIRYGISLYGLSLDDPKPDLKPVMSLKSKVVQIKDLKTGESLGYGASYQAKKDEKIAILPIGYADGFIRKNKNGSVEINNKLYKIKGIICMDACFIKVDETVKVGDIATLFGGLISIDDIAKRLDTINYEVTCQVSYRVRRIYIEGGLYD